MNKKTGKIMVDHLFAGQDSGFIINPDLIMNQMTGSLIQAASKVLHEELAVRQEARHEPRLGLVPDPALQGHAEGHDGDRAPARPRRVRLRRAAAALGQRRDPERDLRRDGRAHDQAPLTPARVRGFLSAAGK